DAFDLLVIERQRRAMGDLRRLQGQGCIGVNPAGVLAEPEKASQVLQALDSRKCRVRPAVSERAERRNVQMFQEANALPFTERQELSLEQLSTLSKGRFGQVAGFGVLEVQLNRPLDGRDVLLDDANLAGGLPSVDDGRGDAPLAGVQG